MAKEINTRILGGWLILVQAFIIFNAIVWLKDAQLFWGLFEKRDSLIAALGDNPNKGLYAVFVYYELIASVLFTFLMFVLFFIFFKRRSIFPKLMIGTLILQIISETFSYFFFGPISGYQDSLLTKLVFSAATAILLIVYLIYSKRVKLTFTV
jgi:hypothetical protein